MPDRTVYSRTGYPLAICSVDGHWPSLDHQWLAGNALGWPFTLAKCAHCDRWLYSVHMTQQLQEHFTGLVSWYHPWFRQRIATYRAADV